MGSLPNASFYDKLDASRVPDHFSRYPVAISVAAAKVEAALDRVDIEASEHNTRERRRAVIRHSNSHGNAFAICHCSAEPRRLVLLSSIVEVLWIHDGNQPCFSKLACHEHDVLAQVIRLDIQPSDRFENIRQRTLAPLLRQAIDIDPEAGPVLVEVLRDYIKTFDDRNHDFSTMAEYMPFRINHCGYWLSSYFIRWGVGMTMSPEDYSSIREYDIAMGNILGLTNDYFSWNVEKSQPTDRIRNGVRVLMKEHGINDDAAKTLLLGIIVEQETKAARLKEERLKKPVSREVELYMEDIELFASGSCYWHATAPRYKIFE
ncbi:hypothetical protein CDD80_3656 [Ophiocordyceps camponoti-rufipedis]|uniref:Terpene synthase n=1 Tax=Ophiocordyceps camponoti-rufipedis TaxID=2004952 RepID=A0A2C5Z391_9HYPO|nr:hypothetical protein CDD80_3656 [Ophiocordyceps camponoti-rufipedis]